MRTILKVFIFIFTITEQVICSKTLHATLLSEPKSQKMPDPVFDLIGTASFYQVCVHFCLCQCFLSEIDSLDNTVSLLI